jgi:malate dehydrogenase (oxaloacetate-decarboxylating)
LVHTGRPSLEPFKHKFAQDIGRVSAWQVAEPDCVNLLDVIENVKPSILIGTSAQPGAFTEQIVRQMAKHIQRPIIFPLSNPASKSEAVPADLINWTSGRALVATGSPFPPVMFEGQVFNIGQCNNAFVFPGVGLGVIASGAPRVTNEMFVAAARALAEFSPALHEDGAASLYPAIEHVRRVSRCVALAVGAEAVRLGLTEAMTRDELRRRVKAKMWTPRYARYVRAQHDVRQTSVCR